MLRSDVYREGGTSYQALGGDDIVTAMRSCMISACMSGRDPLLEVYAINPDRIRLIAGWCGTYDWQELPKFNQECYHKYNWYMDETRIRTLYVLCDDGCWRPMSHDSVPERVAGRLLDAPLASGHGIATGLKQPSCGFLPYTDYCTLIALPDTDRLHASVEDLGCSRFAHTHGMPTNPFKAETFMAQSHLDGCYTCLAWTTRDPQVKQPCPHCGYRCSPWEEMSLDKDGFCRRGSSVTGAYNPRHWVGLTATGVPVWHQNDDRPTYHNIRFKKSEITPEDIAHAHTTFLDPGAPLRPFCEWADQQRERMGLSPLFDLEGSGRIWTRKVPVKRVRASNRKPNGAAAPAN